jgi:hypothetical protein
MARKAGIGIGQVGCCLLVSTVYYPYALFAEGSVKGFGTVAAECRDKLDTMLLQYIDQ